MTTYFVDLGFDWNAEQMVDMNGTPLTDANENPLYELQWGMVDMTGSTSMTSMENFVGGDLVLFNIYDLSIVNGSRGTSGATPQVSNPWMQCVAGDTNTPPGCGFQNVATLNQGQVGQLENGTSTYFGAPAGPVWPINLQGNTGPAQGVVISNTGANGDASYQLTWMITVQLNGASKTYVVDPEMIVKPNG
jgi:hypothetical protein